MKSFNLHNNSDNTHTQISNIFIDEYLPGANGTYVKVYITLIRMLSGGGIATSISSIADILELMDNDVNRAFAYWEKQGLLLVKRDATGAIADVYLSEPKSSSSSPSNINVVISSPVPTASVTKTVTASRESYSANDFKWVVNIVEKFMERPLTPADVDLVDYLYNTLNFSSDLIFYLYEYCISKNKKNTKYIQAVALGWANEGIDTVEKAKHNQVRFETDYIEVMKAFGLNQTPAPVQKQYIDAWLAYGFTSEIIKEAAGRTLIAINEPNFKYTNGILEKWHKAGISTLDDIKKADNAHSLKASDKPNKATPKAAQSARNSFNSYEQRSYSKDDFSSIEQQLLNR